MIYAYKLCYQPREMIYAYKLQSVCGQIQLQLILNTLPNLFAMVPHEKKRSIATA